MRPSPLRLLAAALALALALAPASVGARGRDGGVHRGGPGAHAEPAHARPGRRDPRDARCEALSRQLEFFEALSGHRGSGWGRGLFGLWAGWLAALSSGLYADLCVGLHQVQMLGTHNSYHRMPRPDLFELLLLFEPSFSAWEYDHRRLPEQFGALGIRQIELDVFADPEGGHYAVRPALELVDDDPVAGDPALFEPGFKVLHVQDVDFETTCSTLRLCLEQVRSWSAAHPGHLPIAVLIEAKDEVIPDPLNLGFQIPVPIGSQEFRALDAEIREVFPRRQLLLPEDVRGRHATLEDAVLQEGWPRLGEVRGRVLFLLDNGGAKAEAYRDGAASLEDRVLFTNAVPGEPDAAFVKVNDPLGDPRRIPSLVEANYLVRTRADADTQQARTGDTTRRDAALASGAQLVSSDYPEPDPVFGTGYAVEIPGDGIARCNPVNAPPGCREPALDRAR